MSASDTSCQSAGATSSLNPAGPFSTPDLEGRQGRPAARPSKPRAETANRERHTDPVPARGRPERRRRPRMRRPEPARDPWSPSSALGPRGTENPWSLPGASGQGRRTRTPGHTACTAPASDGQAAEGRVSNPHPNSCRGPAALANKGSGHHGRVSPSGQAGDHRRQASSTVILAGCAPDVP
jgi:hypothetical protein